MFSPCITLLYSRQSTYVIRQRFFSLQAAAIRGLAPQWPSSCHQSPTIAALILCRWQSESLSRAARSLPRAGGLLLEANARPGLAIQIANGRGLVPRLLEIDDMMKATAAPARESQQPVARKIAA